ncbi:MAG: hypothetical protein J5907_09550 [Bacteroidales bacterium]|nr:hypothetical protein [Bacteroidales bacterium]
MVVCLSYIKQAGLALCLLILFTQCSKKDVELVVPEIEYTDVKLRKYPREGEVKIMSFNVRYGTAKESNSSNN